MMSKRDDSKRVAGKSECWLCETMKRLMIHKNCARVRDAWGLFEEGATGYFEEVMSKVKCACAMQRVCVES